MANPRMIHDFEELFVRRFTAAGDSSIEYKRDQPFGTDARYAPVKFTGSHMVGLCEDGDAPVGSLERVEADGSVVVAWLGTVTYAGTITIGSDPVSVVGDGSGGVRAATAGEVGTGTVGSSGTGTVVVFQ